MNFFQRLRDAFSMTEEYEDYYYYEDAELADATVPAEAAIDRHTAPTLTSPTASPNHALPGNLPSNLPSNVIGLPGLPSQVEVTVMEPRSFDEMPQVVTALRERKSVILNLTYIDADQAQRSTDYVAGATFAIDGHQTRLGERIFLFTPNYVHISNYPELPAIEPPIPLSTLSPSPSSPMPPQLSEPVQPRQIPYQQTQQPNYQNHQNYQNYQNYQNHEIHQAYPSNVNPAL